MNNVYEITITKEVMKTNTSTEVVGVEEISNQTRETMESFFREKYGEGEEGVSINIVSSPSKQKPEKYFVGNIKYEPSVLEVNTENTDYNKIHKGKYYYDFVIEGCEKEPLLDVLITFPENTKSIIAYHSQRHSNKTLLPCNSLLFYFSIEKEKVVDLWNKGKISELKKYNIIPKEPQHRNLLNTGYSIFGYIVCHPNHPVFIDEIYKRRKNKKMSFIAVFTCDEWRKTNVDLFYPSTKFCTQKDIGYEDATYVNGSRDSHNYDPITNDVENYKSMRDENGEKLFGRVGTFKTTIDEKGKLYNYERKDKVIINYDTDEIKTYFEEQERLELERLEQENKDSIFPIPFDPSLCETEEEEMDPYTPDAGDGARLSDACGRRWDHSCHEHRRARNGRGRTG